MNRAIFLTLVIQLFLTFSGFAQGEITFLFNKSLKANRQVKWLGAIDGKGSFDRMIMPRADYLSKQFYEFSQNIGIAFTDQSLLKEEYAIEMYFYVTNVGQKVKIFDFSNRTENKGVYIEDGRVIINEVKSSKTVFIDDDYVHFVFSRNSNNQIIVYTNGEKVLTYQDDEKHFVLSDDRIAQFFVDDCDKHTQGALGAIALFKIYPYLFDQQDAEDVFNYLPKTLRGELDNIIIRGLLKDAATKGFIQGAEVIVTSNSLKGQTQTNASGKFSLIGSPGNSYHVRIHKKGFTDFEEDIVLTRANKNLVVELIPLKAGQTIRLESVYFEKGKAKVLSAAHEELNKLAELMIENPKMRIELGGHTDNLGSENLSLKLSEERVASVKEYLVTQGVSKGRIAGKGYGGSKPIANNSTEESRKKNRRVEFTILKFK